MAKGLTTKTHILDAALGLVRKLGFESVSISQLAKEVGMSKSGLFAHFNSKEKMHLMILDHAALAFNDDVLIPLIKIERGLPRLKAIIRSTANWYGTKEKGGCPFVAAAVEYDSRPGAVSDRVQLHLGNLISVFKRAISICVEENHLKSTTNVDQLAYELYSMIIGAMVYRKTLESPHVDDFFEKAIDNVLRSYQ